MKPLFSKSFWCVLAIVLLTSFSAKAGLFNGPIVDVFEDMVKDESRAEWEEARDNFQTVYDFCKQNGNYEKMYDYFDEKGGWGSFLSFGKLVCFPAALADSIAEANDDYPILAGWTAKEARFKWWEGIYDTLSDAVVNITNQTWDNVAPGTTKLLWVALGLWFAMMAMPMVASLKEQNPADFITKIGAKLFKVMFAVSLLQQKDLFFGYFVSPIMATAAGFAGVSAGAGIGVESVIEPLKAMMDEMHMQLSELKAIASVMRDVGGSVDAFVFTIQVELGVSALQASIPIFSLPNLWVIISGCFIWAGALVLSIFFPFRVFDVVFRFGIILALAPLYIAAWCFDITKEFASKGFSAILHVAFTFMFLKITLDLCILLIIGAAGLEDVYATVQSGGNAYQIGTGIVKAYLNSGTALTQILAVIICIIFCCMCLTKADELAGQFGNFSPTSNAAERMGASVVQQAQKAVNGVKNEAKEMFLENHVDNKAQDWATSGNSLKSALGRSYLRHRGADRNELKGMRQDHLDNKQRDKDARKKDKEENKQSKTTNNSQQSQSQSQGNKPQGQQQGQQKGQGQTQAQENQNKPQEEQQQQEPAKDENQQQEPQEDPNQKFKDDYKKAIAMDDADNHDGFVKARDKARSEFKGDPALREKLEREAATEYNKELKKKK